jgi:hypothetical protein
MVSADTLAQQLHHYFVNFIFYFKLFFIFLDNFDGLILKINFKK